MSVTAPHRVAPLIAHVVHRLDYGGLENGLVNLVNRMPPNRYRHAIVCLAGYGREFRRRIQSDAVPVVSIDKRPGKDLGAYVRMWRELDRMKPDIVHTRNLGTVDMQWVAAAAGVRHHVHGEHGWEASDPNGVNPKSLRIRRACRPVIDHYVPMSSHIARWLEREVGVASTRIRLLYNGVDTEKFSPMPQDSSIALDESSERLGAAGSGKPPLVTIGTVGRLDPVKNQASLLRALRSILTRDPGLNHTLRLIVVGEGPERPALESLSRQLELNDRVLFAGAREDVPEQLRAMDLFVLPSINEGISNTILEAMATGLPVVAARVGGNPELIVNGVTGSLYDPGTADNLESDLMRYIADSSLRRTHGAAGRHRAVQNFSLESMVVNYLNLYDEILAASPTAGGNGRR
jgi:sugar transferase (PEP-CTERM/EpsH1 system associated)